MADVAELSITGRVATAADADWDAARHAWNLAADQRPAAVVPLLLAQRSSDQVLVVAHWLVAC
jgi:hypothetical protein